MGEGSGKLVACEKGLRLESRNREGRLRVSTITIELPDEVVPSATTPEEFARELRLAAAIHWYSRGVITQGKGAQIAGMDRRSFILALGRAGVDAIQMTAQELKAEVESDVETRRQRIADHLPEPRGPAGPVE